MRFKCEQVEQLTIVLENRPGILADLCAHLTDRGINVRAITTLYEGGQGSARLVVDKPEAAKATFAEAGVLCTACNCLALEMPDAPGGFAAIARKLALAGINIDYIYASASPGPGPALGIFGVSDLERALAVNWEK